MVELKEILDNGALAVAFYVFINFIVSSLKNRTIDEKNKNDLNNFQNSEMFQMLKNQFEQMNDINHKNFSNEINEIKRLILNSSNMNTEDFEIFMKNTYSNIILQLEKEMICIIDRNHIDANTVSLTHKKVDNLIEKIVNNQIYVVQSLKFDTVCIKQITNFNMQEKEQVKEMMKEIISSYANSYSEYKKEEAKRQIEENIKYIYNAYECHLHATLENIYHNL